MSLAALVPNRVRSLFRRRQPPPLPASALRQTDSNPSAQFRPAPPSARPQAATERVRSILSRGGWSPFGSGYGAFSGGDDGTGVSNIPTVEQFRTNPAARRRGVRVMIADPIVKAGVLQKALAVKQLDLKGTAADKKRLSDRKAADFCVYNLTSRVEGLLPGLIWNIIHPAMADGVGVCEPVWRQDVEDRGPWKGKKTIRAVKPRPPESYTLKLDDWGNVTGIWPAHGASVQELPPQDFLIFSWLPFYGDPRGMSDYEASYKAYCCKLNATRLREIYHDRLTGPFLEARVKEPDDPFLKQDLAAARACGFICLGVGEEVFVHNLAAGSDEVFERGIEGFNREILVGLIGSYLHVLESKTAGARGDTQEHRGITELYEWDLAAAVSSVITEQLVPMLVRANFVSAGLPTLNLSDIDTAFAKAQLTNGEMLRKNGVATRLSQWYEISGWEDPTDDPEDTLPGLNTPMPLDMNADPNAEPGTAPGSTPPNAGPNAGPKPPFGPAKPSPTGPPDSIPPGPGQRPVPNKPPAASRPKTKALS